MCTLVVLNEYIEGFPLVVAGNRDEAYDRPSEPPTTLYHGQTHIIRPWDRKKEGTWIGVAENGWFVGITNQDDGKHDEDKKSRGPVVADCLNAGNHCAAARILVGLDPEDYNPFNVVFGRPGAMFLCRVFPGRVLELEPMPVGINVISNDCWGSQYKSKVDHARVMACHVEPDSDHTHLIGGMQALLSDHFNFVDGDPFQSLCVHADEHKFGTRSSSIITVSNSKVVEYWYSEGHPCKNVGMRLAGRLQPVSQGQ